MRRKAALFSAGLVAAATMAVTPPAAAQTLCFGPSFSYVCVNPTGGAPIEECIYAGPPPCHPVSVPTPLIWCGGALYCDV
ncbi:MAG: hypothetical protein M3134_03860 [Actinomycetota bacterium]|nr:hypothetical protein [Actinomycetota bacterium]